jgi:hypothetical protein
MITAVHTAQSMPGKNAQAIAFANDLAAYLKSKHGLNLTIKMQVGGSIGRICWLCDFESLAEYEQIWNKIHSDKGYHKLVEKASGILTAGHGDESLWHSV